MASPKKQVQNMSQPSSNSVVIDIGSYTCKIGFAGYDKPLFELPSNSYIDDDELAENEVLSFKNPFNKGIVSDWESMTNLLDHAYKNMLNVDPADHCLLITEPPLNPKENREKIAQIMFETFNVPSFYLGNQSVLSLYASGRTTGFAIDLGYQASYFTPVYEGYAIEQGIQKLQIAGKDLDSYLSKVLSKKYKMPVKMREYVDIKEKLSYAAFDYEAEIKKAKNSRLCNASYKLNNGSTIELSEECFNCPELLFQPRLFGINSDGIDKAAANSLRMCTKKLEKIFMAISFFLVELQ